MSLLPTHSAATVRSLLSATPEERENVLRSVGYNIFAFPAGLVTCDFLSDSGTSTMTDVQWAALMRGDESYGRNWGYYCLLDAFRDIFERGNDQTRVFHEVLLGTADVKFYLEKLLTPFQNGFANGGPHQLERPNFFIVPQGRCAEALLFSTLKDMIRGGVEVQDVAHPAIISNGFFDTTGANAAAADFELRTFTKPGLTDMFPQELIGKENHFKGDLDIAETEAYLNSHPGQAVLILITITNNWAAAQPVSMANIRSAAALARRKMVPLFFDACRFAENAYFIQQYEKGYAGKTIPEIVQEMFSYAEGFTISLKKDGLSNMGGVLCFRDKSLFAERYQGIGLMLKERQILCYGNDSYGGMSGRDLMATVAGLYEVIKKDYLRSRITQVQMFAQKLQEHGVAVLLPPGGHAIYLDMDEFFYGCDRKPDDFASVGFTLELLKHHGIRAVEAGPFGWGWDLKSPEERKHIPNLVRFAVPRYKYSEEHINYTVAAIKDMYDRRHTIPNVVITRGKTMRLRHFSSGLKPIPVEQAVSGTYFDEVGRQMKLISQGLDQNLPSQDQLSDALALSMKGWGQKPIPAKPDPFGWVSHLSNDHTPVEYSIALAQETGEAELRFTVEAQPHENQTAAAQGSALHLNEEIARVYGNSVSLDRFSLVRDLFMPVDAQGPLAAWHSCAMSNSGPEWKIYLNSNASGKDKARETTQEAFRRLGMLESWNAIESILSADEQVLYFSLDLSANQGEARVKVYISHPGVSAADIAQKHAAICQDTNMYAIQRFCECMAGGSLGPYQAKPLLSCFAFKSTAVALPTGTIHFPVEAYADNDGVVQGRVEKYMKEVSVLPIFRTRYRRAINAVQRRPLSQGRGIHAWVSLKLQPGGSLTNTFYFSPELFGPIEN